MVSSATEEPVVDAEEIRALLLPVLDRVGQAVPEPLAKAVLRRGGVATPLSVTVAPGAEVSADEVAFAGPYVLKAVSPTVIHKSDVGAVALGLDSLDRVNERMRVMGEELARRGHAVDQYLVEADVAAGVELVVGAVRNELGWVVMVGLGGIFVEALQDVAFGLAPLTERDAARMLRSLNAYPLLTGIRGTTPVDQASVVEFMVRLAGADGILGRLPGQITEVDLNPVFCSPEGVVAADARLVIGPPAVPVPAEPIPGTDFEPLLQPRTIAVFGASGKRANLANMFIRHIKDFGYSGRVVPVHPNAESIEGLPTVSAPEKLPADVDYAYVALPAPQVPDTIGRMEGRVRIAHVVSSGFGETTEGEQLQADLVSRARAVGVRVVGPNCLGVHSGPGRVTFIPDAPRETGGISVISQSGGLAIDLLRQGAARGARFNAVVTVGNGADVTPGELVDHFLRDPDTDVIGLYLESTLAAKGVLEAIRAGAASKPVVLLAGGQTSGGSRAALSHTGALVGNHRLWPGLARQSGAVLVETLPDFINAMLGAQAGLRAPRDVSNQVILFGNGGGTGVLASDALERVGLEVPLLREETVGRLVDLGLPPGNGLSNPIDTPVGSLMVENGAVAARIASIVLDEEPSRVLICHLNVGVILANSGATPDVVETIIRSIADEAARREHVPTILMVLRSDGTDAVEGRLDRYRDLARNSGMTVFPDIADAAMAATALIEVARSRAGEALR